MSKIIKLTLAAALLALLTYLGLIYVGTMGELETDRQISKHPRPTELVQQRSNTIQQQAEAINADSAQILFGDLHAHTTYSIDAFQSSMALMGGTGAHPPADACDFARHCSALDFWSINDHAEHFTPEHWRLTKESIRQCNAVAGDPGNPDMVSYLGWEWTHAGTRADNHYGHKNVIFKDTAEDQVPSRPIHAKGTGTVVRSPGPAERVAMPFLKPHDRQRAFDFTKLTDTVYSYPDCPDGVDVRELPLDCREGTETPAQLFAKLDQWGFDTLVIPHGNSWGIYTPAGTSWDKQLKGGNQRQDYQFLMEIYSGHGNSEEYRDWRATLIDDNGQLSCPAPSLNYTPSCWFAGEQIYQRCIVEHSDESVCQSRAAEARQLYVQSWQGGHNVLGGMKVEDWLDVGQCRDCFKPAFNFRPGGSAQYALSISNFDQEGEPKRFNFGFIGSSDNHVARPGTGYKEYDRYGNTETSGVQDEFARKLVYKPNKHVNSSANKGDFSRITPVKRMEHERGSSFYYTGGLVAVHSEGRDRESIWQALKNKQVYATSGERILLWFDLLNSSEGKKTMGAKVNMNRPPKFRVAAVGAFKQKPGCPDYTAGALGSERMETLCRGECYHPSDERKLIQRIEIIRIRPQMYKGEKMHLADGSSRIEDVWRSFDCKADPNGCVVEFEDTEFTQGKRDMIYYARAIQEPTEQINANNLRTRFDENGQPISVQPCYSDSRTDNTDNCLARAEGRAWSSPIFVDLAR